MGIEHTTAEIRRDVLGPWNHYSALGVKVLGPLHHSE
jgi:hypothetical protein